MDAWAGVTLGICARSFPRQGSLRSLYTDLEAARRLAADLEIKHSYASIEHLVEREDIDAVVIASPSKFHLSGVQTAAAAGKHILCEKPLALTIDGVDDAIAAARSANVLLQVAFMGRYDPA